MYVEQVANLSQLDPKARAKSEMCMMREFMAFVVTRLQVRQRKKKKRTKRCG